MKKYSIFLILIFFSQSFSAQNEVVGSYHISSGNPDDGGYNWFLFGNNEFAMVTFGQIISGTWSQKSEGNIEFTPYVPENSFAVYGRKNKAITGSKVMFNGLDINENTYIATTRNEIQPILNEDANCLSYPTLKIFEKPLKKLLLSCCLNDNKNKNSCGFDYALNDYNDFIIIYFNSQMKLKPFEGKIINEKLQINFGNFSSEKRQISPVNETDIKKYVEQQKQYYSQTVLISTTDYRFGSKSKTDFFTFEENNLPISDYNFDTENQAYQYKEMTTDLEDYEYKILNLYQKLPFKLSNDHLQLNKKSLLEFRCE